MNKTFATFTKALKKDRYFESIQAHLLGLPSYRRFPTDEEFHRDLQTRDLYNFRSRSYWLRRLENHSRRERVAVAEYTIEHVLPQNKNLSTEWREALGADWQRVQETWLHTLGNLTLTAYNPDYSDRSFAEKRDMPDAPEKGLKRSPLNLNQGFGVLETWDEGAIKARAGKLADLAVRVWSAPALPHEILDTYSPKADTVGEYTINDHPYLVRGSEMYGGNVPDLFEAFRKAVLALDPCVREEFLKLYGAFKAETNLVDVIPQAKRLLLSLNMRFADLSDPKGVCRDVTGMGRWGNGDVEIVFSKLDELPYVLGLVRQSLELQLGNGAELSQNQSRAIHISATGKSISRGLARLLSFRKSRPFAISPGLRRQAGDQPAFPMNSFYRERYNHLRRRVASCWRCCSSDAEPPARRIASSAAWKCTRPDRGRIQGAGRRVQLPPILLFQPIRQRRSREQLAVTRLILLVI